jgi:hypothetical protein
MGEEAVRPMLALGARPHRAVKRIATFAHTGHWNSSRNSQLAVDLGRLSGAD